MHQNHRRLQSVAPPQQARSERTLHRILDAAEALIEEKGLGDVSIPEIVRRANCSVGGFYGRLRDKNELLRALEERFFGEQRARLRALTDPDAWGDATIAQIVRGCAVDLVGIFRERGALIRAFVARAVHDVEFRGEVLRFRQEVADRFGALLLSRDAHFRHPNPARAVEFGVAVVFAAMISRALFAEVEAIPADEATVEELSLNFLGYLGWDEADFRSTT
jgi:AcrR family transcriptional regulator